MKILYLTANGIEDAENGGAKCSIRNYKALLEFGEVDVYTILKRSNKESLLSIINGLYPPVNKKDLRILKEMSHRGYDLVFIDGAFLGNVIECFDKIKTVIFYQNCEHDYIQVRFGKNWSIKKAIYQVLIDKAERRVTERADYHICLSNRDAGRINKLYGKEVECISPIGMDDKYKTLPVSDCENYCLLFGALGTANQEGYQWFVKNVSPYLNCRTIVAGKGFDVYKESWQTEKVTVLGFVDSIQQLYTDASCVAIPLLSGGGMKIKTVEALMFGKRIFGTDEAMSGFEFDYQGIVDVCNKPEEFINGINKYVEENNQKYIEEARNMYIKNYSVKSAHEAFKNMIEQVIG